MYQCETATPLTRERDPWNDVRNDEEARDRNKRLRDKLVVPSYTHIYRHALRHIELRRIESVVPAQVAKTRNTHT